MEEVRREALEQLRQMADEFEVLQHHIDALSLEVLTAKPLEEELSIKELYALLVACDEVLYLPAARSVQSDVKVSIDVPPIEEVLTEKLLGRDIEELLRRGAAARRRLVQVLGEISDWKKTLVFDGEVYDVYNFILEIVDRDLALSRQIAERLT